MADPRNSTHHAGGGEKLRRVTAELLPWISVFARTWQTITLWQQARKTATGKSSLKRN
jgi:hypothetical protein